MTVGRICTRTTHLADPHETVRTAARRMEDVNVGTLVVLDVNRRPIGIVTDRDLVLRCVARGLDPDETTVSQVMSAPPRCVVETAPIEDAMAILRRASVRRLPVVDDDGRLEGIVSVDDVVELLVEELEHLGRIVGCARPAETQARQGAPEPAGLERSAADLEC